MNDLTNHYRSPYLLCLPHYRTYFPALRTSSNVLIKSPILTPRRLAFLVIFLLRTLETAWVLLLASIGAGRSPDGTRSNAPWILLLMCVVAFTIELWNLHLIVESVREGGVRGRQPPEGLFTLILFWTALFHVILVGMEVTGIAFFVDAQGTFVTEAIVIAIIVLVAWVANWEVADGELTLA